MLNPDLSSICRQVIDFAKETGAFIRLQRNSFTPDKIEYKGLNDMVSYVDKTAEAMLVHRLRNIIQGAGFITEENTANSQGEKYQWIIDPLDGTTNFIHGIPCYCVSVALAFDNNVVLGVIYEINLNECFYAWENGGAWMNEKKIHVSKINKLDKALLATGFPYTNFTRMKEYMEVFDYCMKHTHGIRRLGSAAVDMAYVACGRFEAFYEYGLNSWDIAAGCCIIKEAGGKLSDFSGGGNYLFGKEIIASNSHCFEEFLEVVKSRFEIKKD